MHVLAQKYSGCQGSLVTNRLKVIFFFNLVFGVPRPLNSFTRFSVVCSQTQVLGLTGGATLKHGPPLYSSVYHELCQRLELLITCITR